MDKLIITIEVNLPDRPDRTIMSDDEVIQNHVTYIQRNCKAYHEKGVAINAEIISEIDLTEGG